MTKLRIYSDGGARGNPGPSGIGAVLKNENNETIAEVSEFIGNGTNNQAEYRAILAGLERAKELGAVELDCFLDSELVVKQLKLEYKVKNADLASLFVKVHNLTLNFKKITYTHIRRELNTEADALANLAMDKGC
ncbi:ribonuclease HI family protein [Candidatus Parcubacteria bacterium]|nr:ribonuclease HI family protein [Patescibacteria group bacterium]MBU4309293.1 ribonuclease HI family protein [Patescibacteria group bacterium]MBU4432270.1 ribonuclease HI family protein [Patescibacteria group bacterium]MBU4577654.1 ribonuclease HI family protein [Patescibacteria group bacterium]MCG2697340.1 ribonuclease HI family protein [Candidatus Parcubacteria bacterium]